MEMKLEAVPLPVTDVDRAIAFYRDQVGFTLDFDYTPNEQARIVQFTPQGSGCSVVFGRDVVKTPPGSVQGLTLVIPDIAALRGELIERGVEVSEIKDYGRGISMAWFSDPDGNGWALQEIASRNASA